jgi:diphthamide biosynthesis methyltransferase
MLYVIGLGLSDEKDITVRGLEAVKSCERVYLEAYTSILMVDSAKLVSVWNGSLLPNKDVCPYLNPPVRVLWKTSHCCR